MTRKKSHPAPTMDDLLGDAPFDAFAPTAIIEDPDAPLPQRQSMEKRDLQIWIRSIGEYLGLSDAALARGAGFHVSLIHKFMNSTEGQASLQTKTLLAIDRFAHDEIAKKLAKTVASPAPDDIIVCSVDVLEIVTSKTIKSNTGLRVRYKISVPIERRWTQGTLIGITIDSEEMNVIYPQGTTLLCVPLSSIDRQLVSGEHVVAMKKERDVYFCYVREFRIDADDKAWLWPKTTTPDPLTAAPIPLGATVDDAINYGMQVAFLIVASVRPESIPLI